MKYVLILLAPFAIMAVINESCRPFIKEKPFIFLDISAMNSVKYDTDKCSWACHNSTTNHCLQHHVEVIKPGFPFYKQINDFYWGLINFNSRTKDDKKVSDLKFYAAMNLTFLVVIWPLIMYLLLINYLRLKRRIRTIRRVKI